MAQRKAQRNQKGDGVKSVIKVYVAGPLFHVDYSKKLAAVIREAGHKVISRWHEYDHVLSPPPIETAFAENMEDVDTCDVLIAPTFKDHGRETYVEIGRALAQSKYVIWRRVEPGAECLSLLAHHRVLKAQTQADILRILKTHGR